MAIINCPKCQKEVSNFAKVCPSCGCDVAAHLKMAATEEACLGGNSDNPLEEDSSEEDKAKAAQRNRINIDFLLKLVKKPKVILSAIAIVLSIILLFVLSDWSATDSVKRRLKTYYETVCKLEDVKVTLKKSDGITYDYYAYIDCSNLSDFSYESMTSFENNFHKYFDDIDINVGSYTCNGDTYHIYQSSVYKNYSVAYQRSYSSSSSSHSCIECGYYNATWSYTSPFSGQIEWYCTSCYTKLKSMLSEFGI